MRISLFVLHMWYNVKIIVGITPPFKLVAAGIHLGTSLEACHPPVTLTLLTRPTPTLPNLALITTLERNARLGHPLSVMRATTTYKL